jgi:hypothetical protein
MIFIFFGMVSYLSFLFSKNRWREALLAIGRSEVQEKTLY